MHEAPSNPVPPAWLDLGLDEAQWSAAQAGRGRLFRVAIEAQAHFALLEPDDPEDAPPRWGELSGRFRDAIRTDPLARPGVGDFVLAESAPDDGGWVIHERLPRRTRFIRRSARRAGPQLVAANVDFVLVVTTPNDDFSPRRLERYLATVHASGARPGLVLNKVDLAEDPSAFVDQMSAIAHDAPVFATSAKSGLGLDALAAHLRPGRTLALVGSSGVGKSSLSNALLGAERQTVAEIRETDAKGRHTTTHRELLRLPAGADGRSAGLLVDTPGMRALGLWVDADGLLEAFADIQALSETCRFRDCHHRAEPGCAVRAAEEEGSLSSGRLASFLALSEEIDDPEAGRRHRRGRR